MRNDTSKMKKLILGILLSFCISSLIGQSLEFFGGTSINTFYDFQKNDGHFNSNYEPGWGYTLGIAFDYKGLPELYPLRFVLRFDHYSGKLYTRNGGLGGSSSTNANIEKSCIDFGIYPVIIKINKNLKINIGGEFSFLISEKKSGNRFWHVGPDYGENNLEDEPENLSSDFNFGIVVLITYRTKISEGWYIVPQYQFYWGLTNEFTHIQADTKSIRNYLLIGISKDLRRKSQKAIQ